MEEIKTFVDHIVDRIISFENDERPDELKAEDGLKLWEEFNRFIGDDDPELEEKVIWEMIRRIDVHPRVTMLVTEIIRFGIQNLITSLQRKGNEENEHFEELLRRTER